MCIRDRLKLTDLNEGKCRLEHKHSIWAEKYVQKSKEGFSPGQAAGIGTYLTELGRLIREAGEKIEGQTQVVEQTRWALIEKMKERRVMETLHDKKLGDYLSEQKIKRQAEVDDIIVSKISENK
jgi:flagellar export protein FliJ